MNAAAFYNQVRHSLFNGKLTNGQVKGMQSLIDEFHNRSLSDRRWLSYILATVKHETANTMQPIEEYGKGKNYDYGKKLKMSREAYETPDKIYYGRGYCQLTWYENYKSMGDLLGIDLLNKPELALNPSVAAQIIYEGMIRGSFTGKKLGNYFNDLKEDWTNARKIINGLDKAEVIAIYAKRFYAAINGA